jgi:asparagine synthetase B (glutamine-hydrolysing)
MSVDLAAIRTGIVNVLATIPEIVRVNDYADYYEAANNLPYAAVFRGAIQGQGITLEGETADHQLGGYDHLITWTIRVYQNLSGIADAQEFDDIIAARLLDAFNNNRLLDPNGPGVVDSSRIALIVPFTQQDDHPAVWISEATLQTFVIASL